MDGHIGDFLDTSLAERKLESFPANDSARQPPEQGHGAFGGILGTLSDVQVHARQAVEATQNISDQASAIKANSQTMGRASTQARSVSLGLNEQAETINALVKGFLAEIRKL